MLMPTQRASEEEPNGEDGSSLKLREITGIPNDEDQTILITHSVVKANDAHNSNPNDSLLQ